jgi:hypothetical protein
MSRVLSKQRITGVREALNFDGQALVTVPESRSGAVVHRSVQRPSRASRRASSANASNRPSATSRSNCRSQAAESNSANQVRNATSSSSGSLRMASSISWIVLITSAYRLRRIEAMGAAKLSPIPSSAATTRQGSRLAGPRARPASHSYPPRRSSAPFRRLRSAETRSIRRGRRLHPGRVVRSPAKPHRKKGPVSPTGSLRLTTRLCRTGPPRTGSILPAPDDSYLLIDLHARKVALTY